MFLGENFMAKIDEKRREKILNGNMWGVIISICSPLFLYYLFTSIYSFVDMIFANEISTGSVSSVAAEQFPLVERLLLLDNLVLEIL